jgi:hypothetical protein
MNHVKNHREFTLYGASLQSMAAGDVAPVRQRWFRMLAEAQQREIETAGIPDSAAEIAEARAIARGMAEGQLRSIRSL